MRKSLLLLLTLGMLSANAQSIKNENINVTVPSYAMKPAPENIKTFMGAFAQNEGKILPFTEQELQNELNFQSFVPHTDDDTAPDLMLMLSGISRNDLDVRLTRNKANKTYSVGIIPKSSATIDLLVAAKEEMVHLYPIPVKHKADAQGNKIPEVFDFSFEEEEKYLIFEGEDRAKASPYLILEFLKRNKSENYLTNYLLPEIYAIYDNRASSQVENFHYLKDKKNPVLEEETKGNLLALEKVASNMQTLEALRAGKNEYAPFVDFWKEKLSSYDLSSKAGKKIGWGILVNLHKISLITEDFNAAKEYIDKAVTTGHKKWITQGIKKNYEKVLKRYESNYDISTGSRKYVDAYIVDESLKSFNKKEVIKENNINKAQGYVLTKKGEKMEGKISIRFSEQGASIGNIVELSGDTFGKRAVVTYINEKGKTKNKIFKCKEVSEIVVDGKTFKSINPKKPFMEQEAVTMSMLNTTVFMQSVFESDKISVFRDLTDIDAFYFKKPGVKKAEKASVEFFTGCETLVKKIENEEFSTTEDDQIKIAKIYAEECK